MKILDSRNVYVILCDIQYHVSVLDKQKMISSIFGNRSAKSLIEPVRIPAFFEMSVPYPWASMEFKTVRNVPLHPPPPESSKEPLTNKGFFVWGKVPYKTLVELTVNYVRVLNLPVTTTKRSENIPQTQENM